MTEGRIDPTLWELFYVFARISVTTIGGGYVMLPVMEREVVEGKGWLSVEELVDYFALGQSIPGIIAMNTATLVGYKKRGVEGALAAAAGMAVPSVGVILCVAAFLVPYLERDWVQRAFSGIRAAVVALVGMAVWRMGRQAMRGPLALGIGLLTLLAVVGAHISPVWMLLVGGALGLMVRRGGQA